MALALLARGGLGRGGASSPGLPVVRRSKLDTDLRKVERRRRREFGSGSSKKPIPSFTGTLLVVVWFRSRSRSSACVSSSPVISSKNWSIEDRSRTWEMGAILLFWIFGG